MTYEPTDAEVDALAQELFTSTRESQSEYGKPAWSAASKFAKTLWRDIAIHVLRNYEPRKPTPPVAPVERCAACKTIANAKCITPEWCREHLQEVATTQKFAPTVTEVRLAEDQFRALVASVLHMSGTVTKYTTPYSLAAADAFIAAAKDEP